MVHCGRTGSRTVQDETYNNDHSGSKVNFSFMVDSVKVTDFFFHSWHYRSYWKGASRAATGEERQGQEAISCLWIKFWIFFLSQIKVMLGTSIDNLCEIYCCSFHYDFQPPRYSCPCLLFFIYMDWIILNENTIISVSVQHVWLQEG